MRDAGFFILWILHHARQHAAVNPWDGSGGARRRSAQKKANIKSLVYCTVVNVFLDWDNFIAHFVSLTIAYVLALPIGWDREKGTRSAGLRTFPLVGMASCGFIIIAQQVARESPEAQARIIEGVITGIGFIGGGAILKDGGSVRGTATAASIWNTGAIGAAVAYGYYEIAIVLSVMNFLTLRFLTPLEQSLRPNGDQSD
jgi:putative Mg2+ transporter-C (MgtC) family protein